MSWGLPASMYVIAMEGWVEVGLIKGEQVNFFLAPLSLKFEFYGADCFVTFSSCYKKATKANQARIKSTLLTAGAVSRTGLIFVGAIRALLTVRVLS